MSENQKRLHVQHYYSTNNDSVPEVKVEGVDNENALIDGEIAINHADEKLFIKKNDATKSNDVVTFSSDEKLDEKYAPKKDYVVNGENENVQVRIKSDEMNSFENINIKMGEFDYVINGSVDSAKGIGVLVENEIDSSGLIVGNGYVLLNGESESGSSSTNGGSVELFGETVCLNAWNKADYDENFDNTLTLNKNGLIFNDSRVVTEQILGEHDELVKVDENGIANKNEITIGTFEIKNDKPYNYTLEGHYEPLDWVGIDENATDCTFVAEYNHEGAKLYADDFDVEDYWVYEFVVTEAKIYLRNSDEWVSYDGLVGNVFPINAAYLDTNYVQDGITPLVFTDDVADLPTLDIGISSYTVYDAKITRSIPFSLKHTSKALLNGVPVATIDDIQSIQIVKISYKELYNLKENANLKSGTFYRITDYECTTTQADSRSANHPFDIIVQALDESTLSENAQAIQHEGDEYFANAKLETWQLKYTIDNDASRFAWAKEQIIEQPAKWSCGWGILEERYDDGVSTNYTEATIDGEQKYLYRPTQPTSYLEGKTFYHYEGREMMSFEDASELYFVTRENPFDYGEQTSPLLVIYAPTGRIIRELEVESDYGETTTMDNEAIWNTYFGEELDMQTYGNTININGVVYYTWEYYGGDNSMLDDWATLNSPFILSEGTKIVYNGSTDGMYYAFDSIIGKYSTEVYDVTDGNHIYKYENEDEGEGALLDTISYTNYIAPREGGKGVIYRMIDEHNNDCPFDFKNMQFLHSDGEWYYAFSFEGTDASLSDACYRNYICPLTSTSTYSVCRLPRVILNTTELTFRRGIVNNRFNATIEKAFITSRDILDNIFERNVSYSPISNVQVYAKNSFSRNHITMEGGLFVGIETDISNTLAFHRNTIIANNATMTFKGTTYLSNTIILGYNSGAFVAERGSFINNYIEDSFLGTGGDSPIVSGGISLDCPLYITNSKIKLSNNLTIEYAYTTSTKKTLCNLDINASGWDSAVVTIPDTFPTDSPYELKVAKNSNGVIKMWCDADLIK